jgi:hypothetical protein
MALLKESENGSNSTVRSLSTFITIEDIGRLRQIRMLELDKEFMRQARELKRLTKAVGLKIKNL